MGVHDLWSILEPVRESVPLYSLSGKTLAVDLSLWVCEAQHVQAMMGRVTKPHLRNLFFRVSSLTLMGVKLVFVMEGEAPKIKADTMNKRTEARFGGFKKKPAPTASKTTTNTSRGRFKAVLRECAEMLDYLGVPWVTAAGEAEAMCAYLDSQGLVDGCITNDGDAFLYGARTVYRNFNMNSKDPQVECYQTCRVQTQLKLSRENLVGLAVLLGCDYIPKGIPGVGKEQALKFIHSLKGQTLLQKFAQWKDDDPGVCEEVVKKVPHCLVCRHPGSAKTHERGGCRLCDSERFCQPQDFDYQCPCDWHRYEQRRQAMSLETSIKKKTLTSQQFPFTEIIHEFLISKDKPVSHFKRRQPNLLSMQKFANDKMEWPKHYTSEKVLVLMTYTEMMNRKYGKGMSSQIKPLRILKPRVRNSIACFEVIWTTPEHYSFPEDHPPESQLEVNTVEEESLFGVAFPELVESYLRDKALAEENKTKKKKPKSKKEKPCDASDGITDLLAQMSLQTSSANSTSQPQVISKPEEPEVVDLCSPVNRRENRTQHVSAGDCPATPLSHGGSAAAASPSVSSVIDALHLSDIDWETASFTSSPAPQAAGNRPTEPRLETPADGDVKDGRTGNAEQEKTSRSAPEVCYTECPLRDRVLLRNAASALNQASNPLNNDVTHMSSHGVTSKPSRETSSKGGRDCNSTIKKSDVTKTDPLSQRKEKAEAEAHVQAAQDQLKDTRDRQQKYKFARSALSASSAPPQRLHSDPGPCDRDRNVAQATKKSVCLSLCSSSDDDTENRPSAPQGKSKMKHVHKKNKDGLITDFLVKAACGSKTSSQNGTGAPSEPKPQRHSEDADVSRTPVSAKGKCLDVAAVTAGHDVVVVFSPASPVTALDSDDSAICSDSPLPLAERLRLKFLK